MLPKYKRTAIPLFLVLILIHESHQVPGISPDLQARFGDALEAIFGMGVRLQALLQDKSTNKTENFLVSPLSASLIIGQLMLGAEGEFRDQLYELMSLPKTAADKVYLNKYSKDGDNTSYVLPYTLLHLQLGSLVRELKSNPNVKRMFTFESTNALFVNDMIDLKSRFEYESSLMYDTQIKKLDFTKSYESMKFINQWASDHTNGLIKSILPTPPNPATSGIFANAVYFLGEWEQPFSNELNTQGPFYLSQNRTVGVTYMTGFLEGVPYAESKTLDCKMIVLPYLNREVGMYMILPNKGHKYEHDIRGFAQNASPKEVIEMVENVKNKDATVKIPKLTLSTSISILEPLKKYASFKRTANRSESNRTGNVFDVLKDKINAFETFSKSYRADDSDILLTAAAHQTLRVSDILQQMTFSVNEKGSEVAAITAGVMDYSGGSKTFLGNRPFMFFIRHESTATTLFWGTISNPSA